jgi:hypothetical protein
MNSSQQQASAPIWQKTTEPDAHSGVGAGALVRFPFLVPEDDDWVEVRDGHPDLRPFYNRHYSAHRFRDGRQPPKIIGPGQYMALLAFDGTALFCWRKAIMMDGQEGVNCAVFRNEGKTRSSDLIRQAMTRAWKRWHGERLFTYVNPKKIASRNPGYCFKCAGWTRCGTSLGGLHILEALPGT